MVAQQLIKINFEFIFPNDSQTNHLIHENAMVKSADNNFTICFLSQTSVYSERDMLFMQITIDQTNSE